MAQNVGDTDLDLTFRTYAELLPEDQEPIRQIIWAKSPTLGPYERDYPMGMIRVSHDEVGILYALGLPRTAAVRVYFHKDDRLMPPQDGLFCGAARGLDWPLEVSYILSGPEGERELEVSATSLASTDQTFPFYILGWVVPAEAAERYGVFTGKARQGPGPIQVG